MGSHASQCPRATWSDAPAAALPVAVEHWRCGECQLQCAGSVNSTTDSKTPHDKNIEILVLFIGIP